jgi:RimJ/RimL family protein N-acetyltransferase
MIVRSGDLLFDEFKENDKDFDVYVGWLKDYENMKFVGRQEYFLSMDIDTIRLYVKNLNLSENDSFFKVYYKDDFIGTYKVGHIDWRLKTADMGIMIGNREFRNKGLSRKIMLLGVDYAFGILGLRRLIGQCYADNISMCKCFESCGFRLEGREIEARSFEGRYVDHVLYGLLRKEYKKES